jgi:hypothetical protein
MDEEVREWFVGVDWASRTHHVRVSDARARKVGERAFERGGEGLAAMAAWLLELTGAPPGAVFVAIEVPHGPVVESLMEHGFRVHSINPKQLDRFRDRFSPAGAKDDSRDAQVLAMHSRPIPAACGTCRRSIPPSSSSGSGRASPRTCGPTATASATASECVSAWNFGSDSLLMEFGIRLVLVSGEESMPCSERSGRARWSRAAS